MKSDRPLAVVLKDYPYRRGEPYFHRELRELCKIFPHVYLFSRHEMVDDEQHHFRVPGNVTVVNIHAMPTRGDKVATVFSSALSGRIFRILADLRESGIQLNISTLKTALAYDDERRRLTTRLLDGLSRLDIRPENLVWYSYWSDEAAYTLASMSVDGVIRPPVFRNHNFDLYVERQPFGLVPYRRFITERASANVSCSEHGMDYLRSRFPNNKEKICCHRLGVEDMKMKPVSGRKPLSMVTLSNIAPVKNLEAVLKVLSDWDGPSIHWHHIGTGHDSGYEARIKAMAADSISGGRVNITFHGFIPNADVLGFLRGIHASFLLNVSHFEGIPVSMMEAASIGLPIIGPNVCGVPEIVLHGENGFLIDPHSPDDIRDRLHQMATMPDEHYEAMCRRSQEIQRERFNAERNYRQFAAFLADAQ